MASSTAGTGSNLCPSSSCGWCGLTPLVDRLAEVLDGDFAGGARVERAILALGDIARIHLYRWGDGGAHFHVWFLPRRLGMIEASGMALPVWEDVLPNVPDEELCAAAERIAGAM